MAKKVNEVKEDFNEVKEEEKVVNTNETEETTANDIPETEEKVETKKEGKVKRWLKEKGKPAAETALKIVGVIALVGGAAAGIWIAAKHGGDEEYSTEEPNDEAEENDNVIPFPDQQENVA